jgi:hypothetical protein
VRWTFAEFLIPTEGGIRPRAYSNRSSLTAGAMSASCSSGYK